MKKILIVFAHPRYEQSRTNRALIEGVKRMDGVTVQDLYEWYPNFNIDIFIEKDLLKHHDLIVWHHPLYWYSCPPLLKQWIDMVLEFGWAYGPEGNALEGKQVFNVLTAGGTKEVYCEKGRNHYTIREFLRPFEQTARLCSMEYLPPFAVMGTHRLSEEQLATYVRQYQELLRSLQKNELEIPDTDNCQFINDLPALQNLQEK
ncbi:MAG: NAD(P)H-dependent oxidoreductase [Bacteroidota bacterium]